MDSYLRCFTDPTTRAEVEQSLRDAVATEIALASRCLEPCDEPDHHVAQTREQAEAVATRRQAQLSPAPSTVQQQPPEPGSGGPSK